jgi:hypothetical protein
MNRSTQQTVSGKLSNEQRQYEVRVVLQITELWRQRAVPDDYLIERVSLHPQSVVPDDHYTLEYNFNGKNERGAVRVAHGVLCSA